jgi:hypothetical protein
MVRCTPRTPTDRLRPDFEKCKTGWMRNRRDGKRGSPSAKDPKFDKPAKEDHPHSGKSEDQRPEPEYRGMFRASPGRYRAHMHSPGPYDDDACDDAEHSHETSEQHHGVERRHISRGHSWPTHNVSHRQVEPTCDRVAPLAVPRLALVFPTSSRSVVSGVLAVFFLLRSPRCRRLVFPLEPAGRTLPEECHRPARRVQLVRPNDPLALRADCEHSGHECGVSTSCAAWMSCSKQLIFN